MQIFEPILFTTGSKTITEADKKRLQQLAAGARLQPHWRIEITGMTDSEGSIASNRKIAAERASVVTELLWQNGVKDNQLILRFKLSDTNNISLSENPR
ncbi:MAG: OmpA family protein [Ferruginibacter sp.]